MLGILYRSNEEWVDTVLQKMLIDCASRRDLSPWNEWRSNNPSIMIWLEKVDLRETYLANANLSVVHLDNATLSSANLNGVRLWNAYLQGVNFDNANLSEARLEAADLERANFTGTRLKNTDFGAANLKNAKFDNNITEKINFTAANLSGAKLFELNMKGGKMQYAILKAADLQNANLKEIDLTHADLSESCLQGAILEGTNLRDVDLQRTNLERANLKRAHLGAANLEGASLKRANLEETILFAANLEGANLEEVDLEKTNLGAVNLKGACLRFASFEGQDLSGINFEDVNAQGANFKGTYLGGNCLKGADFSYVMLDGKTMIQDCSVDDQTNFASVGLDSARIELSLLAGLKTNIRRIAWGNFYSYHQTLRKNRKPWRFFEVFILIYSIFLMGFLGKVQQNGEFLSLIFFISFFIFPMILWALIVKITTIGFIAFFMNVFWWISDYGSSTKRVLVFFLSSVCLFTCLYAITEASGIDVLSKVEYSHDINFIKWILALFFFSFATMVTLGFGEINVILNSSATLLGMIFVCINLFCGYFLLAVLVTRIGILFQSLGPELKPVKRKRPHDGS